MKDPILSLVSKVSVPSRNWVAIVVVSFVDWLLSAGVNLSS